MQRLPAVRIALMGLQGTGGRAADAHAVTAELTV